MTLALVDRIEGHLEHEAAVGFADRAEPIDRVGADMAVDCLELIVGEAGIGLADREQLGALVGLAMVTSSLATLLVLPAMLTLIARTPWIRSVLGTPTAPLPTPLGARSSGDA